MTMDREASRDNRSSDSSAGVKPAVAVDDINRQQEFTSWVLRATEDHRNYYQRRELSTDNRQSSK